MFFKLDHWKTAKRSSLTLENSRVSTILLIIGKGLRAVRAWHAITVQEMYVVFPGLDDTDISH